MFIPFTEAIDESADFDLISQANCGNRDALGKLVFPHRPSEQLHLLREILDRPDIRSALQLA